MSASGWIGDPPGWSYNNPYWGNQGIAGGLNTTTGAINYTNPFGQPTVSVPPVTDEHVRQLLETFNVSRKQEQQPKPQKRKTQIRMDDATVKSILDAGRAIGSGGIVDPNAPRTVFVVPDGYEAKALEPLVEKYLPAPRRIKAKVNLSTPGSFQRYVKEHMNEKTRVFVSAGPSSAHYCAFIDFIGKDQPSWAEHTAQFSLQNTPEWTAWVAANARGMGPTEFAQFIEAHMAEIQAPPGADMLEVVQTLEARADARYTAQTRLTNGKTKISFEEDVSLKGSTGTQAGTVEFPSAMTLGVAPFEGTPAYRVDCRLRYRLQSGRIVLWYEMVDTHLVVKQAIADINETIKKELGLDPLEGSFQALNT